MMQIINYCCAYRPTEWNTKFIGKAKIVKVSLPSKIHVNTIDKIHSIYMVCIFSCQSRSFFHGNPKVNICPKMCELILWSMLKIILINSMPWIRALAYSHIQDTALYLISISSSRPTKCGINLLFLIRKNRKSVKSAMKNWTLWKLPKPSQWLRLKVLFLWHLRIPLQTRNECCNIN